MTEQSSGLYDDTRMKLVFCWYGYIVFHWLYVYSAIRIEFEDRVGGYFFLSMLNLFFLVLYLTLAYYFDIFSISKYVMRFDRFLSFFFDLY